MEISQEIPEIELQESDGDTVQGDAQQVEPIARPGTNTPNVVY